MLPPDKQPKTQDIFAAQKIIADISTGLYRSPAAAIKELISNAYDADAREVTITTDVPDFRTLVISDNGSGMTLGSFLDVISHIGGSRKRIIGGDETPIFHRKIIGRIGIGLLAVAQLGFRFYVTSSVEGDPNRFIAEVDLEPFHKDDAALASMGKITGGKNEVLIGAVKYVENIPEDVNAHYTVITVPTVRQGLISEITRDVRKAVGAREKLSIKEGLIDDFSKLIEITRSTRRLDTEVDGYYYMLWELGNLSPVNYVDNGPFETRNRQIEGINKVSIPRIRNFSVTVDDIELKRPQLFPSTRALDYPSFTPKIYPLDFDRKISGRRLKFSGYVYAQKPRIDPEEFRGVHVRIRNVGIGKYDRTWMGYPFDEGIKFGQITGEIFVEDGLEPALNIDRDSFRETDVHYQALRAYLWDKLRKEVFPDIKRRQSKVSREKKFVTANQLDTRFQETLSQLSSPVAFASETIKTKLEKPNISNWIEAGEEFLNIDKEKWKIFLDRNNLTSKDARDRFIRVLKVLISNELIQNLPDDEVETLLDALAIAVQ